MSKVTFLLPQSIHSSTVPVLINLSNEDFTIENGERIAQLVIAKHERADWTEVEVLSETARGEGGFGSTGVK